MRLKILFNREVPCCIYTLWVLIHIRTNCICVCVCQFRETDVFDRKVPCFIHKLQVLIHMRQIVYVCMC